MAISVAIVEDDDQLRTGLQAVFNGTPGYVSGQAYSSAERAIIGLMRFPVDVVLMDIRLKEKDGIWCTSELISKGFAGQILMLSVFDDDEVVFDALQAGASGYLQKDVPPTDILESVAELHSGGSPMTASVARKVIRHFRELKRQKASALLANHLLSKRESELVEFVMRGLRYAEIATELGISLNTVKGHIRSIYEKLQVSSRGELMARRQR